MVIFNHYFKVFKLPLAVFSFMINQFQFFALNTKNIYINMKVTLFNAMQKERKIYCNQYHIIQKRINNVYLYSTL